jgi:hypothetical protein
MMRLCLNGRDMLSWVLLCFFSNWLLLLLLSCCV